MSNHILVCNDTPKEEIIRLHLIPLNILVVKEFTEPTMLLASLRGSFRVTRFVEIDLYYYLGEKHFDPEIDIVNYTAPAETILPFRDLLSAMSVTREVAAHNSKGNLGVIQDNIPNLALTHLVENLLKNDYAETY